MKTIFATVALAFLAIGCAADEDSETGQDQSELQNETPASEAAEMPGLETQSSSRVQTNCHLFCASEYQDCLASGSSAQQCRVEQRYCIIDFCL
jgi:hypothetical protein